MHGEPRNATPVSTGPGGRAGGNAATRHEPGHGGLGSGSRGAETHPGGGPSPQHNGGQNLGRPEFGRSQAGRNPGEGYRGNAQQFGRPAVSQGMGGAYRGGAQAFGRPQAFQTPMAARGFSPIGRGFGGSIGARPAPAMHFGGGGVSVHHR